MTDLACLRLNRAGALIVYILVAPRANSNRVMGIHAERLKIAVTAPPVDGRANALIIEFIADLLGMPKRSVVVTAGAMGRRKEITIVGISLDTAQAKLATMLAER